MRVMLTWLLCSFCVVAWHYFGLSVERPMEAHVALFGRAILHAAQFGLGYLLGKLYLLRCRQCGGNAALLSWLEALAMPAVALLLSTRSHELAKWFAGFPAVVCFVIAMVAASDHRGDIRRLLAARFRLDEREKTLYTQFPPASIADMLPWHVFVSAFTIWAAWRIVVPMLR
jgi:hypothetical protein